MATYSIGDLERLLRVKNHVIRYWEKEIPLIQPQKSNFGRRIYRDRDLQILFRLKYLLYDRRYTIEGAKAQLYLELTGENQDLRGRIAALRSELLSLLVLVQDSDTQHEINEDNQKPGTGTRRPLPTLQDPPDALTNTQAEEIH